MIAERDYTKKELVCKNCLDPIKNISMNMGFIWVHKHTNEKECRDSWGNPFNPEYYE